MIKNRQSLNGRTLFTMVFTLICFLVVAPNISAWEWDNVKEYDAESDTYTITNALGFGDTIAVIKLNTPHIVRVGAGYNYVAEFEMSEYDVLYGNNAFQDMNFYQINDNMKEFSRDFDYKYLTYELENVSQYGEVCDSEINDTYMCRYEEIGEVEELQERWVIFSDINELPQQESVRIRIYTKVEVGDYVEWIPTLFGEYLTEWAVWSEDLNADLVAYYKMDETSGTEVVDSTGNQSATNNGAEVNSDGKIDKAYSFVGSNNDNINVSDAFSISDYPFSFNFWVNSNTTGAEMDMMGLTSSSNDDIDYLIADSGTGNMFILARNGGSSDASIVSKTIGNGSWVMVTVVFAGDTDRKLYLNGASVLNQTANINYVGTDVQFRIGNALTANNNDYTGLMDEVGIWDASLTVAQVQQLYNEGSGITYSVDQNPTITHIYPGNMSNLTSSTLNLTWNATDDSGIYSTRLFINGTLNQTNTTGVNGTYNYQFDFTDGNYSWSVGATDTALKTSNMSTYNFSIDSTSPVITITEENYTYQEVLNGNISVNYTITEANIDDCWYDYNGTNLTLDCDELGANIDALTTDNDITIYMNDTFGNEGSDSYTWTITNSTFSLIGRKPDGTQIGNALDWTGTITYTGNPYLGNMIDWINESYPNYNFSLNVSDTQSYYVANNNITIPVNATSLVYNTTLNSAQLVLNFTYNNGTDANVWGRISHLGGVYNFSGTGEVIVQENLSQGPVKIVLNTTGETNWTQFYEYENDLTTNVNENITILEDASQTSFIGVYDQSQSRIENALVRVSCRYANATDLPFGLISQRLTGGDGITFVNTDPDMSCLISASADDYVVKTEIIEFGDNQYGNSANRFPFYLERSTSEIIDSFQAFVPSEFEDMSDTLTAVVYAPLASEVTFRTEYMEDNNIANGSMIQGQGGYWYYDLSCADGFWLCSTTSNITIEFFSDGTSASTETATYDTITNIFDLSGISMNDGARQAVLGIGIIMISGIAGMAFASFGAGVMAFMVFSLFAGYIDSTFWWLAGIAGLYFLAQQIRGLWK